MDVQKAAASLGKPVEYDFAKDGFIFVRGLFPKATLDLLQQHFESSAERILNKVGVSYQGKTPLQKLELVEQHDKKAFFELCTKQWIESYPAALLRGFSPLVRFISQTLDLPEAEIYSTDSALFFNSPSVPRLQVCWHTEKHYFASSPSDRLVNLWMPIFNPASEENGTMWIAPGSHLKEHKCTRNPVPNGITQMKIEEEDIAEYEKIPCDLALGDAVIFDLNLVHRSGTNRTQVPRTSLVVRYCDFETKFFTAF